MESYDPAHVLFVCTANQCRSPLAEEIAKRGSSGSALEFSSAGLLPGGLPVPPRGVRVAASRGLDLSTHLSRQIRLSDVEAADVILTMTRAHSREVVALDPEAWPRVFTVKQFARWLPGRERAAQGLRNWLNAEARDRSRAELFGAVRDDDVVDPMNSSARVWRRVAVELEDSVNAITRALTVNPSTG